MIIEDCFKDKVILIDKTKQSVEFFKMTKNIYLGSKMIQK